MWVVVRCESLDHLSDVFNLVTNDFLLVTWTADSIAVNGDLSRKALVLFCVNLERFLDELLQDNRAVLADLFLLLLFRQRFSDQLFQEILVDHL